MTALPGRTSSTAPAGLGRRAVLRGSVATAGALALAPAMASRGGGAGAPVELGPIAPVATISVAPPPVVSRVEWGADESLGDRDRYFAPLRKAIIHHTAVATPSPWSDPRGQMRAILRAHTGQGWSDFGYHFAVDPHGTVYEGRWARAYAFLETPSGEDTSGRLVTAAHAANHNTGSLGVALLGDYSSTGPTAAAVDAVARVIAWKFGPRGIDPYGADPYVRLGDGGTSVFPNISGHRDVGQTGCPGNGVYPWLADIRNRVAGYIAADVVGQRVLGTDGTFFTFGDPARFDGAYDIGGPRHAAGFPLPVRAAIASASGRGALVVDSRGGIYCFGDATFHGSLGGIRLNQPIVGMAGTPSGNGYWLVASDGGIFTFGDARFFGSTGAVRLNRPIVGMAGTPSGDGYWLVASDGGIFTFGDARFFGSLGAIRLNQPIVGMAATPSGNGYWLVAADGGVFTFGDAPFHGAAVGRFGFVGPAASIVPVPRSNGYWVLDAAGNAHPCGAAPTFGFGIPDWARPARALVPVRRA